MTLGLTERDILDLLLALMQVAVILGVGIILSRIARGWILRLGTRKRFAVNLAALLANIAQVAIYLLAVILILPLFGVSWTALLTVVGTAGLAISLAFQDLLRNFIAGIYILIERPFQIGDQIAVSGDAASVGTVQTIGLRTTSLRNENGLLVIVPNGTIFTNVVTNHSAVNMQRHRLDLSLPADDHPLTTLTTKISDALHSVQGVAGSPEPSTQVENISAQTLKLEVEFWTPPAKSASVELAVTEALRLALPSAEVTVVS